MNDLTPLQQIIRRVERQLEDNSKDLPSWTRWEPGMAEIGHLADLDILMKPYGVSIQDAVEPRLAESIRADQNKKESLRRVAENKKRNCSC